MGLSSRSYRLAFVVRWGGSAGGRRDGWVERYHARRSVERWGRGENNQACPRTHLDAEEHLLDGDGRPPVLVLVQDAVGGLVLRRGGVLLEKGASG